jgi:hypothetical protein
MYILVYLVSANKRGEIDSIKRFEKKKERLNLIPLREIE